MREMSGGFRDDLPPRGEALTEAALEAKFKQLLLPWLIALAALMVTLVFLGTALEADGACTLSRHSSAETVKRCLAAYKKAQAL